VGRWRWSETYALICFVKDVCTKKQG
jgi:hypothetical protein